MNACVLKSIRHIHDDFYCIVCMRESTARNEQKIIKIIIDITFHFSIFPSTPNRNKFFETHDFCINNTKPMELNSFFLIASHIRSIDHTCMHYLWIISHLRCNFNFTFQFDVCLRIKHIVHKQLKTHWISIFYFSPSKERNNSRVCVCFVMNITTTTTAALFAYSKSKQSLSHLIFCRKNVVKNPVVSIPVWKYSDWLV